MSSFVQHSSPTPKEIRVAVVLTALWAIGIGILWFVFRRYDGEGGGFWNFAGRLHVIAVHLPVGILMLAALLELASRFPAYRPVRQAMPLVLLIGLLSGIGATVLGYLLMGLEGVIGRAMDLHLWTGLSVVVFTFFALLFRLLEKPFLYVASLLASLGAVSAAGHYGGSMVHEADYLSEHAPEFLHPLLLAGLGPEQDPAIEEVAEGTPVEEINVYAAIVAPIMEAKCNECHNANKIKGDLRLDTHELMMAGSEGSDFPTVIPRNATDSELIVRVTLPEDDSDFMPPKGEPLTPDEIELLELWIEAGATTELLVADLADDPGVLDLANAFLARNRQGEQTLSEWKPVWDSLSGEEQQSRLADVRDAAAQFNFSVMPISADDDRLRVNVINSASTFGDEQLALLEPVAERIAWLDLARSAVSDDGLRLVGRMRNLERLHLENTRISSAGVAHLAPLAGLRYLNLYGTQVDNEIFAHLEGMPHLQKLFVWQTGVDPSAARRFEEKVNLQINTGAELRGSEPPGAPASSETPAEGPGGDGEKTPSDDETAKTKESASL